MCWVLAVLEEALDVEQRQQQQREAVRKLR